MSTLNPSETLVLIGAAVAAGCRPCLDVALGRALELGLDQAAIVRARELGAMAASRARTDMEEHANATVRDFFPTVRDTGTAMRCSCSSGSGCQEPAA